MIMPRSVKFTRFLSSKVEHQIAQIRNSRLARLSQLRFVEQLCFVQLLKDATSWLRSRKASYCDGKPAFSRIIFRQNVSSFFNCSSNIWHSEQTNMSCLSLRHNCNCPYSPLFLTPINLIGWLMDRPQSRLLWSTYSQKSAIVPCCSRLRQIRQERQIRMQFAAQVSMTPWVYCLKIPESKTSPWAVGLVFFNKVRSFADSCSIRQASGVVAPPKSH